MKKSRVIAIANHKGGVGKTTIAHNLAVALGRAGQRVLALDLDPQGHLSLALGGDPMASLPRSQATQILCGGEVERLAVKVNRWILKGDAPGHGRISLIAAGHDLEGADAILGQDTRHGALAKALQPLTGQELFTLADCRPALGALTKCAIMAADLVLVPVAADRYAIEGLADIIQAVTALRPNNPPQIKILVNKWVARRKAGAWMDEELQAVKAMVLDTRVRRCEPINQAAIEGRSVLEYRPGSNGAADFKALAGELAQCLA